MRFGKRAALLAGALAWSGCAAFNAPFVLLAMMLSFLMQLVWFALSLPFRLLPLAIKYAPLALLFVEGTPETPLYLAMADRIVFEDVRGDMPMTCYRFTLRAEHVPHLARSSRRPKLLLLDRRRQVPDQALPSLWQALAARRGSLIAERPLARRLARGARHRA